MAKTATTGFFHRKNLVGDAATIPSEQFKIANSTTIKIGDAVRINTGGFAVLAGVGAPVLGIVSGIVNYQGINPFALGTGAGGATLTPDDKVVTASNNQTRADYLSVEVSLDPAGLLLYFNDADGDFTIANLLQFFDCAAGSAQITQGSASDASGQFQLVKLDPDGDGDASKGLFRISECQLRLDNTDAIIGS